MAAETTTTIKNMKELYLQEKQQQQQHV